MEDVNAVGCEDSHEFCNLCRVNFSNNKPHVYSKKHRGSLQKILDRFFTKIKETTSYLKHPRVNVSNYESSVKIWCYFCESEVDKHSASLEKNYTIFGGGLLKHLNSTDHLKNCKQFWWNNRMDVNKMNTYILSDENYSRFAASVEDAVAEFEKQQFLAHQEIASSIRKVDEERQVIVQHAHLGESETQTISQSFQQPSSSRSSKNGNTMLPPWMQPDEEVPGTSRDVGPNMQDYQRHLAQEKTKKLPPNRVGANFDRDAAYTPDWLPSFGRVWNSGRRESSKKEFYQQNRPHHRRKNWNDKREIKPYQSKSNSANVQKYVL